MEHSPGLSLEGSPTESISTTDNKVGERKSDVNAKRKRKRSCTRNRPHSPKCNCELIPASVFNHLRDQWKKVKKDAKSALIGTLIGKRIHGFYVSRDCIVIKMEISASSLAKYSKPQLYIDNRGKHGNRPNAINKELKEFIAATINACDKVESHYTSTTNLRKARMYKILHGLSTQPNTIPLDLRK